MIISKLFIENFQCHEKSYIDFSRFSSAIIIAKMDNNENFSNGAGKTSIFKAIEFCLFNQSDSGLEKIIRDDTNSCAVTLDFFIGNKEYRISRKRTKKGTSDLSLFQRTENIGTDNEIYLSDTNNDKFWKDISGRRTGDTEKELEKLIKINFKSFRNFVHFVQNDFSGLTTSTPEKRKALFKEALDLVVYSKLEKIAKDKSSIILKDIDKNKILIESFGDLENDLNLLNEQLSSLSDNLSKKEIELKELSLSLAASNDKLNNYLSFNKDLEIKHFSLLEKEKNLLDDKSKIESSVEEYSNKMSYAKNNTEILFKEFYDLKNKSDKLSEIDFSKEELLNDKIDNNKQKLIQFNNIMQDNIIKYEDLKIPFPDENACKHCRQQMTDEHKKICKASIIDDMDKCQKNISSAKKEINTLNVNLKKDQQELNNLINSKKQLEKINNEIYLKNKELESKKNIENEYYLLFDNFSLNLENKEKEYSILKEYLNISFTGKISQNVINEQKKNISEINFKLLPINKELSHLNGLKAVLTHDIEQKNKNQVKLIDLKNKLDQLNKKYIMYPKVIQAFSSSGIPNLIIQNVLEELQQKANELLTQLKPGLQLSFFVEKTKGDGTEGETLDISYSMNGKERHYEQLSGAMKLAATFSLKLGLSFLLQNIMGIDIKFLLLDEVDQSLDKASIEAFINIIKYFQTEKDMKILIITHNDKLKDYIFNSITVKQNKNMISSIEVI